MSAPPKLAPHPRLYLGPEQLARLGRRPKLPYLQAAASHVARKARLYARLPPLQYRRGVHNEHLIRAREVQARVLTLLVRWHQTRRDGLRDAALRHIEQIGQWDCWSWITWRRGNHHPDAIFDLSYGENSATLAIAYDLLADTLSRSERAMFLAIARKWSFRSGLKYARPGACMWFGRPDSNWNTVCAGGLGMLALAMYEDAPEARKLLPAVEKSVAPFFQLLDQTDGGWPEGIGYWNYGMQYGLMYLLSHEHATGRPHPLLRSAGMRKTLSFPMDFCPHGQACSFGDVNQWAPRPIHYAAAARLGCTDVMAALDARLARDGIGGPAAPWPAEWLALHPGRAAKAGPARRNVVKLYKGLDWAVLADAMPRSRLYVAVRGGTTKVPHGHRDLLSFHCVVRDERLITDVKPGEYLDTTFSPRREELFEISPASKNTLLINGVGITPGSSLDRTERIRLPGAEGVRLVATSAFSTMRDGPVAAFCGRVVLLLDRRAVLIIDRVELPHPGRVESRMHTFATVKTVPSGALIRGERRTLRVAYACDVAAGLFTAVTAPTTPTDSPATALRWCTLERLPTTVTMATLLSPGSGAAKAQLKLTGGRLVVTVGGRGWRKSLKLTRRLRPARR